MKPPPRSDARPPRQGDGDAAWGPSLGLLAVALGLMAAGLVWWWNAPEPGTSSPPPPIAAAQPRPVASMPAAAATPAPIASTPVTVAMASAPTQIPRHRDPSGDLTPDLADYVNPGEQPTMAEVIDRLHRAGVHTGLGAFSPPGTRPPLIGLAVPEDFVLPAGYVRHHQATDDGQRIEAVLMFAPDAQLFDAAHRPIALPADRVVPPELAPPGLPLRRIVVPAPVNAPRAGG